MRTEEGEFFLLVRVGTQLCALPLQHVDETMRPQPVRVVAAQPRFVRGVAVIRGTPVPVVDAASALGSEESTRATRFVTLRAGQRRVALGVDQVLGVRQVGRMQLSDLPPLLGAASEEVVSAIGTLDTELLMVLRSGKLVPEALWAAIEAGGTR